MFYHGLFVLGVLRPGSAPSWNCACGAPALLMSARSCPSTDRDERATSGLLERSALIWASVGDGGLSASTGLSVPAVWSGSRCMFLSIAASTTSSIMSSESSMALDDALPPSSSARGSALGLGLLVPFGGRSPLSNQSIRSCSDTTWSVNSCIMWISRGFPSESCFGGRTRSPIRAKRRSLTMSSGYSLRRAFRSSRLTKHSSHLPTP
eukprot:COSAG04_NODE_1769_length_5627_cov_1.496201_5_plen_208_part_00